MPLVLGIAASTGGATVEIRDADDGRLYASGRRALSHGGPSVDPVEWWHALVDARRVAGGVQPVAVVAATAPTSGLVLLDDSGAPLQPVRIGRESETADDALRLRGALGGSAAWVEATGSVPTDSTSVSKLATLRRTAPGAMQRVARVLAPHDWLTFRLSRRYATDRGDASTTGYWSPRESRWRPDLLSLVDADVDWGALLPRVLAPTEPAGDREGVTVAAGTGEPMAVALGLGLRPGDVAVWLDAPGAVFAVRERPTEDRTGLVAGYADATGRYLPLVRDLAATSVTDAVARVLGVDVAQLDQLALRAPPGARGTVMVPPRMFAGRLLRGALLDIDTDTSPEDVARAAVEGVVCELLAAIDTLRAADVPTAGRLCLAGGGARSHAFQRAFADLSGRAVHVPSSGSVSARGACLQAAAVARSASLDALTDAWGDGRLRVVEPHTRVDGAALRERYARAARAGTR